MKVHDSAHKHGVDPEDAVHAAEHAVLVSDLDEDSPARQLRLGWIRHGWSPPRGRGASLDSGKELLIHAMQARRDYLDLLD